MDRSLPTTETGKTIILDPLNFKDHLRPSGGTRGANEHQKVTSGTSVIGNDGRNDWFRGACPFCKREYILRRSEKSKSVYRCKNEDCQRQFVMYKGFFDRRRTEVIPPQPKEFGVKLFAIKANYDELSPNVMYGSKEEVKDVSESDKYTTQKIWKITATGAKEITDI